MTATSRRKFLVVASTVAATGESLWRSELVKKSPPGLLSHISSGFASKPNPRWPTR